MFMNGQKPAWIDAAMNSLVGQQQQSQMPGQQQFTPQAYGVMNPQENTQQKQQQPNVGGMQAGPNQQQQQMGQPQQQMQTGSDPLMSKDSLLNGGGFGQFANLFGGLF